MNDDDARIKELCDRLGLGVDASTGRVLPVFPDRPFMAFVKRTLRKLRGGSTRHDGKVGYYP